MTTSTTAIAPSAPSPDLAAIKLRQQATWASGDYHMIGTQILIAAELLIESLDLHSTERVLDVATGSGNAALAAARRGLRSSGSTTCPHSSSGPASAPGRGVHAEFLAGDAEDLPFQDASFDVVSSVFGVMFAPDQEQTASELSGCADRAGGSASWRTRRRASSASCS